MRLKHIKLSGFKSFVDPTTVSIPAKLVGVVGPNGCGKSNVIDAVRWVMGESSAKTLRGDSMADVIFNGSAARKPIGKAAVELVFDNHEGKAPGAYAQYNEISIRRELTRDGQSNYYVNKTRCRRRDITDIFLGTGLGPRSYSIIEQGMVSRIVEAKPEELRVLIEEAAGISKYKDRRRETETRIRHTRDNLARVEDIRGELETQLRRLKRQSSAAARYKELKQEEHTLKAQLMSLRWRRLDEEVSRHDGELARTQKDSDARLAEQREVERQIEALRSQQSEANEDLNTVQGQFYRVGAEIAGVEQSISHLRESRQQQQQELERLVATQVDAREHLEQDRLRMSQLNQQLTEITPRLERTEQEFAAAEAELHEADRTFQAWQAAWDEFGRAALQPEQEREVQRTRIEEHEQQILRLVDRETRLQNALADINGDTAARDAAALRDQVSESAAQCERLSSQVDDLELQIRGKRAQQGQLAEALEEAREQHHALSARLDSLRELQAAALGERDPGLTDWLTARGLDQAPRLAADLQITAGWERAVDRVLGPWVGAVQVSSLAALESVADFSGAELFLVEQAPPSVGPAATWPRLADRVQCQQVNLDGWLHGIYVADDLDTALGRRTQLASHESIVTREGSWVGRHWLALANSDAARAGVMARESEMEALLAEVGHSQQTLTANRDQLQQIADETVRLERELETARRDLAAAATEHGQRRDRLSGLAARVQELATRQQQLQQDLEEVHTQLRQSREHVDLAQSLLGDAVRAASEFAQRRDELTRERDRLRGALDQARLSTDSARDARHGAAIERQRLDTELAALQEGVTRLTAQQTGMARRQHELEAMLQDDGRPEQELQAQLAALVERRVDVEQRLARARDHLNELDDSLRRQEQARAEFELSVQAAQEIVQQQRMARQEALVRRDTLSDQISEAYRAPAEILAELPAEANEDEWQQRLDQVMRRIERIGPVNLVAIEEYEEQSERKVYLDKQHQDLSEALATLESVINRIDRETRALFKDTFEKLNGRFQEFFPRLFGGGSSYLELTSSDLLETGVGVMARPPGKRNSTIHLLSGGEKALTAVSLLFAFFDLNPAPFCMLDEVDAPLDDANVERYSEVLKTLADRTQLIFITHNKITMEVADILVGVTMGEPGVSRLVAVDVQEAMAMAAQ